MSSSTFTWTCIGSDPAALNALHAQLTAAVGSARQTWAAPLQAVFEAWDEPFVMRVGWLGSALRCVIDTSSHDALDKEQLLALQAAGVDFLRSHVFNSQVGESATSYHQGTKRIAAKAFPMPELPEGERLYELILNNKDAALAKEIKAGASPNALADGQPVYVHAMRAYQEKSIRALLSVPLDWSAGLHWAGEVAGRIASHGGKKAEGLLRQLLTAPGADVAQLARQQELVMALAGYPPLLRWLLEQPGVDVNAPTLTAEPSLAGGSLLFHSVELFKDDPAVLALLQAMGARSIPAQNMTDSQRLDRVFWRYRDAETPAQLAAAGVNLETPVWNDFTLLRCAMRSAFSSDHYYLDLMCELLDLGARADFWMAPAGLQREVLGNLFDAKEHERSRGWAAEKGHVGFCIARHGPVMLGIVRRLLERGLDANLVVQLNVADGIRMLEMTRPYGLRYRGGLLGAFACLICGRGSALRSLCLPLVELLLAHGASPHGAADLVEGPWEGRFDDIRIEGDWTQIAGDFSGSGTVLERLVARQAEVPDAIDAQLIAALQARA